MHNFGKGTIAKNRSKKGGTIKVIIKKDIQSPREGTSASRLPAAGRSGKVQMVVTEDGDMIARSGKALKFTAKKKHNLAKSVKENEIAPKNTPSNKLHH